MRGGKEEEPWKGRRRRRHARGRAVAGLGGAMELGMEWIEWEARVVVHAGRSKVEG